MTPMLQRIYQGDGGSELLDVLMKYLYVVAPLSEVPTSTIPSPSTHESTWSGELTLASSSSNQVQGHGIDVVRRQRSPDPHQSHPPAYGIQSGWWPAGCGKRVRRRGYECPVELAREGGGRCRDRVHRKDDDGLEEGVNMPTWALDYSREKLRSWWARPSRLNDPHGPPYAAHHASGGIYILETRAGVVLVDHIVVRCKPHGVWKFEVHSQGSTQEKHFAFQTRTTQL